MKNLLPERHADDCDCVAYCPGGIREWVEHEWWDDAKVCTCYLKAVMERRAIYGDERLIPQLPFELR